MSEEEKKAIEKFDKLYIKSFHNEKITKEEKLSYFECFLISNLIEKLIEFKSNSIQKSKIEERVKLVEETKKTTTDWDLFHELLIREQCYKEILESED